MKKKWYILIALVLLLAVVLGCLGVLVYRSPEYALWQIASDVKASGLDGLLPHLTGDARKILDTANSVATNPLVLSLVGVLGGEDLVRFLQSELQKVQWELVDLLKGSDHAQVIIGFHYEDLLSGSVQISMVREDGTWKIDGLELPTFEKTPW